MTFNTCSSLERSCLCEWTEGIIKSILQVNRNGCEAVGKNKGKTSNYLLPDQDDPLTFKRSNGMAIRPGPRGSNEAFLSKCVRM